jgi:hypothetical protein
VKARFSSPFNPEMGIRSRNDCAHSCANGETEFSFLAKYKLIVTDEALASAPFGTYSNSCASDAYGLISFNCSAKIPPASGPKEP